MIVEGYEMHVYCDYDSRDGMQSSEHHGFEEGIGEFFGYTRKEAYQRARGAGWKFHRNKCHCPKHRKFTITA